MVDIQKNIVNQGVAEEERFEDGSEDVTEGASRELREGVGG